MNSRIPTRSGFRRLINTVAVSACALACIGCETKPPSERAVALKERLARAENYTPPPEGTKSLVRSIAASRNEKGYVTVLGELLLPHGTKIWVEMFAGEDPIGQAGRLEERLGFDGDFEAKPFDVPLGTGKYAVRLTAFFNTAWQSKEVLAFVGKGGSKLPVSALEPDDPEFPKAGGSLRQVVVVDPGPLSPELTAIDAVKHARLVVEGKGQSVGTVNDVLKLYREAKSFQPGDWTAAVQQDGTVKVSLPHRWGKEDLKIAEWQYNPRTKVVRYLDPNAKIFSWLPPE